MRALCIHFVMQVHSVQCTLEGTGLSLEENQKGYNKEYFEKAHGFIKVLVQIGIPLFFYISGLAASFFDTEKKGYGIFMKDKIMRLIVPFIIAVNIVLIPRLYFAQNF